MWQRKGVLAAGVILLAALLRAAGMGLCMFIDEVHAIRFTAGPLSRAMQLLPETPGTAPLDYGLVNLLQRVSLNEWFLRAPYALAGVAAVWMTYRIGERLLGARRGLIAAAMLALSSAHIFYSQSIRNYSLGVLLLLLAVDGFQRLMYEEDARGGAQFLLCAVLAALNQFFAFLPLGFLFVYAVAGSALRETVERPLLRRRVLWLVATAAALAVIALVCKPLILSPKSLGALREGPLPSLLVAMAVKVVSMFASFQGIGLDVFVFILFLIGCVSMARRNGRACLLFAVVTLLPAPFILLQEMRLKSSVQLRHFVYMAPYYFLAVSCGVAALGEWLKRFFGNRRRCRITRYSDLQWQLGLCVIIGVMMLGQVKAFYSAPYSFMGGEADLRPDLRTPAERIEKYTGEKDILVSAGVAQGPWRYVIDFYLARDGQPRKWIHIPDIESLDVQELQNRRVVFVYFDFPYKYVRDFTNSSKWFRARPLNDFVTLFEPVALVHTWQELLDAAEKFCLLTAPPSDFGLYSQAYMDLGSVARMQGELDSAEEYQKRGLEVAQYTVTNVVFEEIEAREELGRTYMDQGMPGRAYEEWKRAADLLPPRVSLALLAQLDYHPERLYARMAKAARELGNRPAAREHARSAMIFRELYSKAGVQAPPRKRRPPAP